MRRKIFIELGNFQLLKVGKIRLLLTAFDLEKTKVTDPKRIEAILIPIAFAYVFCMLEGDRKEMAGEDISKPLKGKTRMVGLFLKGLRSISRHLRRSHIQQFKQFIRQLLSSVIKAWKIRSSCLLDV